MLELRRWRPFEGLSTLHRDVDELFRKTFQSMGELTPGIFKDAWYPVVDCFIKEGRLVVHVEVPGIDPKDIDISVLGNKLTIKGTKKAHEEMKDEDYIINERYYGSFERSIMLPEGVLTDKVHASFKDGLLEIAMPCESKTLPRKIPIEVEEGKRKAA